jgi:hypothetical protein
MKTKNKEKIYEGDRVKILECRCGGYIHESLIGEYVGFWSDSAYGNVDRVQINRTVFCHSARVTKTMRKDTILEKILKEMMR